MSNLVTRGTKGSALTHNEGDTNLKKGAQTKALSYTVVEGDNRDSIDCTATLTITLPDAAIIAAAADTGDFEVTLNNTAANTMTITCVTGTDTIAGSTSDFVLTAIDSVTLKVNQAGNGYNIVAGGVTATGQVLTSPTITGDVTGSVINLETPVATTSGSTVDFTSTVPTWAKKVNILLDRVGVSGTDDIYMRMGVGGTLETTGYDHVMTRVDTSATQTWQQSGNLYAPLTYNTGANDAVRGVVSLHLIDSSTNTWVLSGVLATNTSPDATFQIAGRKALAGVLDSITLYTSGTDTFDLGQANLSYE
ncbi:MAG: hypothetical protein ABFS03_00960 [Chloroflexota bacterium]